MLSATSTLSYQKILRNLNASRIPGLVRIDLARSLVVMAATLSVWGLSLLIETYRHQHVDIVVLAVAVTVTLAHTELEQPSSPSWLPLVVLPAVAAAASCIGEWIARDKHYGDALFAIALAAFIWIRRLGTAWTKAGTLASLPFIAALVTPFTPQPQAERAGWSASIGLAAALVALPALAASQRLRVVPTRPVVARPQTTTGERRVVSSTRMAVQMGAAVALGFVIGRNVNPSHWQWPVLTAYIVVSGNQGRGDVIYKSIQRGIGAAFGTVAASLLSGQFGTGNKTAVALIFVVLWIAVLLRRHSYAYWAGSITAALALVYGYFGDGGITILEQRLEGIGLGAVAGALAAWYLLPIRTTDVLRKRTGELIGALSTLLTCIRASPGEVGAAQVLPVLVAVTGIERTATPLAARARALSLLRLQDATAGLPSALERCAATSRSLIRVTRSDPSALTDPAVAAIYDTVLVNLTQVRASLRTQQAVARSPVNLQLVAAPGSAASAIADVLRNLDDVLLDIGAIVNRAS